MTTGPGSSRELTFGRAAALCALSGGLLAAAFPPVGWWFLSWAAAAPWAWACLRSRPWTAFLASYLGGFVFFSAALYWVAIFGWQMVARSPLALLPWLLLAMMEAGGIALTGLVVAWARPKGWSAVFLPALLWAGLEWVRGLGTFGFPWAQLGQSQVRFPAAAQWAAYGGIPLVSFLVLVPNCALAVALLPAGEPGNSNSKSETSSRVRRLRLALVAVLAALAWGQLRVHLVERSLPARPAWRVAIVQASLERRLDPRLQERPWQPGDRERYLHSYGELTLYARGTGLVVWSEASMAGFLNSDPVLQQQVEMLARLTGSWLIAGGPALEGERLRNSAFAISPEGRIAGRYDKVHLVPFGEFVPGRRWLPLLRYYPLRDFDYLPGRGYRPLPAGAWQVGPMICFESIFPEISRELARRGAQALVVLTNDAWFGRTAAARQHADLAAFRAIETGLHVLRGAASGISQVILPSGRVVREAGLYHRALLTATIHPSPGRTLYDALGPAFCWLSLAAAAGLAAKARWSRN